MRTQLKTDRGVAGLTILLSVVTMLFVIGLLVMIFSLMGGELRDATYTPSSATVTNETGAFANLTGYTVDQAGALNGVYSAVKVWNVSNGYGSSAVEVPSNNWTFSTSGVLTNSTTYVWPNLTITYSYTFSADNTATDVINDTTSSIATVTDWFPIFVVISAMVVLILLTVIIITAIRGSGLMSGGSA